MLYYTSFGCNYCYDYFVINRKNWGTSKKKTFFLEHYPFVSFLNTSEMKEEQSLSFLFRVLICGKIV